MNLYNVFDNVEFCTDGEIEELVYEDEKIKIIRILSLNQSTSYMIQDELEIVKIVEGVAELEIEGDIIKLKKGDILPIYPGQKHRVLKQDRVIWMCIFVKN